MNREEILQYVTYVARCEILRHATTESCILSGKIVSEIFRRIGIASQPLTVSVIATNEVAHQAHLRGENPQPGQDGAFAIGIKYIEGGGGGEEFWSAHLTLLVRRPEGGGYLVDPSCDQMTRPELEIFLRPQLLGFADDEMLDHFLDGNPAMIPNPTGGGIQYVAYPTDLSYLDAPDWHLTVEGEPMYEQVMDTAIGLLEAVRDHDGLPPLPPLPRAFRTGDESPEAMAHAIRSVRELGITPERIAGREERKATHRAKRAREDVASRILRA